MTGFLQGQEPSRDTKLLGIYRQRVTNLEQQIEHLLVAREELGKAIASQEATIKMWENRASDKMSRREWTLGYWALLKRWWMIGAQIGAQPFDQSKFDSLTSELGTEFLASAKPLHELLHELLDLTRLSFPLICWLRSKTNRATTERIVRGILFLERCLCTPFFIASFILASLFLCVSGVLAGTKGRVHRGRGFLKLRDQRKIVSPPGFLLNCFADFFFSSKTMNQIVSPILSDLQFEYFEALHCGRKYKACWVRFRGYWSFWKALGLHSAFQVVAELCRVMRLS